MQITFHGAANTVTGSKHLITLQNGKKILLDCGLFQGEGLIGSDWNRSFGFDPLEVDLLVVSHAHIDHTGLIPRMVAMGYEGPVYATSATIDLCNIMLKDSAHIQQSDTKFLNKRRKEKHQSSIEPLYSIEDVDKTLELFKPVKEDEWFQLTDGVELMFTDNAHILGSCAVNLRIFENDKTTHLTFTGDIGRPNDKILSFPKAFPQADVIICESTYGNRLHEPDDDAEARLLKLVLETCVEKRGKILIPAFSIDRTQEIIYALDRLHFYGKLPTIQVYVDSPLSVKATMVMNAHRENFNPEILDYITKDGDPFCFPNLHYISEVEQSKAINDSEEPCIIISASGMAEAGRIKHHIANNVEKDNTTILLVGYASPGSLAGKLKEGAETVRIFGEEFKVNARVEVMDNFSAHADYKEMIQYLSCQDASKVHTMFLVHGTPQVQGDFAAKLKVEGYQNILIPHKGQTFSVN